MELTHWPLYGLVLRTPRLELRLPTPAELDELAELAARGVHDPAVMPFDFPWTDAPREDIPGNVMQYHWRRLGEWDQRDWHLPLTVFRDGTVVGTQELHAKDFPVVREVATGSWLGLRHQGMGIGTEMRAAVLHLAFAGLGAESATSGAHADNAASRGVSRRLGYRPNGFTRAVVRETLVFNEHFVLSRDQWQWHRTVPVAIDGLAQCLAMFGLTAAAGEQKGPGDA